MPTGHDAPHLLDELAQADARLTSIDAADLVSVQQAIEHRGRVLAHLLPVLRAAAGPDVSVYAACVEAAIRSGADACARLMRVREALAQDMKRVRQQEALVRGLEAGSIRAPHRLDCTG